MVLKNFIRFIINKFLNNYIEELNYERLKVDFRHGHVCLEQLHLKPEALVDLGLPVTVATGYLEKLTLTIPWKHLYTHPTKVSIDGLFMLIVPKNEFHLDLTEYHADKMRRVQRKVDNLRKAACSTKKTDEKETTLFERMKLQIMQNLHITIRNVHISYETMSTTKLGHPFSFGLTIHLLELITTTNKKTIGRAKENSLMIFQIKRMDALALYWNTQCHSRISMTFNEIINDLKSKIATDTYQPANDQMNYLLYPSNLKIRFTMTLQPSEFNFERPAYDVDILIEEIDLTIDPRQLSDLLDFIKFQNYSVLYDRCREYRELYLQLELGTSSLTLEQQQRIQILESKLDVFNLAYIRHSVELEISQSYSVEDSNRSKKWRSWWRSKHDSRSSHDHRKSSVSSSTMSNGETLAIDSASIDVKVKITNLSLNLSLPCIIKNENRSEKDILCPIKITDAIIDFKRHAISSNILVLISLQSFSIYGMKTNPFARRPLLVTRKSSQLSFPQMHSEFELSPKDKRSDYRFNMVIQPLQITYHAPTINQIVSYFDASPDQSFSIPLTIKHRTQLQMEEDLKHGKVFDLNVTLQGISLLLPAQGLLENFSSSLVQVDFDGLVFKSSSDGTNMTNMTLCKEDLRFYTKYQLQWHKLRVIYSDPSQAALYLVRQIPILDITFYKCIYSDDASLLDWYIVLSIIPFNEVQLSQTIVSRLIDHLQSIPLLCQNLMETMDRINTYFTIFLPQTSLHFDLSIHKCILLLSLDPAQVSLQLDIDGHIIKTRNPNDQEKKGMVALKNIIMSYLSTTRQYLQPFYLMFRDM